MDKRKDLITKIATKIGKALDKGKEIDFKKVVFAVMDEYGVARRTATEYVEVAFYKLGLKK